MPFKRGRKWNTGDTGLVLLFIGACLLLSFCSHTAEAQCTAGSAVYDAIPEGEWAEVSCNTMADVDPCPANNCLYSNTQGQSGTIRVWVGGAFAETLGPLGTLIQGPGGGHNSYDGNEVYGFDLHTRQWVRLTEPFELDTGAGYYNSGENQEWHCEPGSQADGGIGTVWNDYDHLEAGNYSPCSAHMYAFPEWNEQLGSGPAGSYIIFSAGESRRPHALDLTTFAWSRLDSVNGVAGANWSHIGGAATYDPTRGVYWMSNWAEPLLQYDPNAAAGSMVGTQLSMSPASQGAGVPPARLQIYGSSAIVTSKDIWLGYDNRTNGGNPDERYLIGRSLTDTGSGVVYNLTETGDALPAVTEVGFEYVAAHDAVYLYDGRGHDYVYKINVPSGDWITSDWVVERIDNAGSVVPQSMDPDVLGRIYNRWRYVPDLGVFVVVLRNDGPVYAWRPPSGGGAPDTTPPTAPNAPTFVSATTTGLTVGVSGGTDDVGITEYCVQVDTVENVCGPGPNLTTTGQSADTTYSITATAKDAAGNESPASSATNMTTDAAAGSADADWIARSTASGVTFATRFDVETDVTDHTQGPQAANVVWETANKVTGNGSLRFNILKSNGTDHGNWRHYLKGDQTTFGDPGDEFYVQYRVFTPSYLLDHQFAGTQSGPYAQGFKTSITSRYANSNTPFELVVQNTLQRNLVQAYYQDGVSTAVHMTEGRATACSGSDIVMQPVVDRGANPLSGNDPATGNPWTACQQDRARYGGLYSYGSYDGTTNGDGSPDPLTGAETYASDGWVTILQRIEIGANGMNDPSNTVEFWVAQDGQAYTKVMSRTNVEFGGSGTAPNDQFEALWLLAYMSNAQSDPSRQDTYMLIDEVIVSTDFIPAPAFAAQGSGGTGGSQLATATSFKGERIMWVDRLYSSTATGYQNTELDEAAFDWEAGPLISPAATDALIAEAIRGKYTAISISADNHWGALYPNSDGLPLGPQGTNNGSDAFPPGTFTTRSVTNIKNNSIGDHSESFEGWAMVNDMTFDRSDLIPTNGNTAARATLTMLSGYVGDARAYLECWTTENNQQVRLGGFNGLGSNTFTLPTPGQYSLAFPPFSDSIATNYVVYIDGNLNGNDAPLHNCRWWVLDGHDPDEYVPWKDSGITEGSTLGNPAEYHTANTATLVDNQIVWGARTLLDSWDPWPYLFEQAEANGIDVYVAFRTMRYSANSALVNDETLYPTAQTDGFSKQHLDATRPAARALATLKYSSFANRYSSYSAWKGFIGDYHRTGRENNVAADQAGMQIITDDIKVVVDAQGRVFLVWGNNSQLFLDQGNQRVAWINSGAIHGGFESAYGDYFDMDLNGGSNQQILANLGRYTLAGVELTDHSNLRLMISAEDRTNPTGDDPFTAMTADQWRRSARAYAALSPSRAPLDFYELQRMHPDRADEIHTVVFPPNPAGTLTVDFTTDGFADLMYQQSVSDVQSGPVLTSGGIPINSNTIAALLAEPINRSDVEFSACYYVEFGDEDKGSPIVVIAGQHEADDYVELRHTQTGRNLELAVQPAGTTEYVASAEFPGLANGDYICARGTISQSGIVLQARNYTQDDDISDSLPGTDADFRDQFMLMLGARDGFSQNATQIRIAEVSQGVDVPPLAGFSGDTTPPVITLIGPNPQTIEAGDAYTELGATATDDVDGDISGDIVIDAGSVNTAVPGSYLVTYNVSDSAGNAAVQVTRTVDVVDTTAPVITLTGANPQTLEADGSYTELGATATDTVDGDLTGSIVIDATAVNMAVPGSYSVTYDVDDAAGNSATQVTRTVNVVDTTAPVITLTGANPQTLEAGSSYVELGATATDTVDGDLTGSIVIDASAVNMAVPGSYVVTYDVDDAAGNSATQVTRTVDVVDTTAPVITLTGANPQILEVGGSYSELGATATDTVDGDLTSSIVIDASGVNMLVVGSYSVLYDVSDAAGNDATQASRTVDVVDTTAPSVPTGLAGSGTSATMIAVSWDASTDLVGVVGYRLRRNSVIVADQVGLTFDDAGLAASTPYDYTVSAYDGAGNESAESAVVTISTQASANPDDVIYMRSVEPDQKNRFRMYRGNNVRLVFEVKDSTGALVDISGFTGRFLMANSTRATPFVDKLASNATGVFHVDLSTADTDRTGSDYYEFVVTDDAGNVTTFAFGRVYFTDTLQ